MPRTPDKNNIPVSDEIVESMRIVGAPLFAIEDMLLIDNRLLNCIGLYFTYIIFFQKYNRTPTIEELTKLGCGSAPKLAAIRKELIEHGYLESVVIRKEGRIVAKRTKITSPRLKNLNIRKPTDNMFINKHIYTPILEEEKLGICSSCKYKKIKELDPSKKLSKSKSFPREDDFNLIWHQHPRKVNKVDAKKAWKSKPVQDALPAIKDLLTAHTLDKEKNAWESGDPSFIPHLSTWFRGHRWLNHMNDPKTSTNILIKIKEIYGFSNADIIEEMINEMETVYPEADLRKMTGNAKAFVKWLNKGKEAGIPSATKKSSLKDILPPNGLYWKLYRKEKSE